MSFFRRKKKTSSISRSLPFPMVCPNCNHRSTFDIWVIVDIDTRSDLLQQLLKNTLFEFSCDNCTHKERLPWPVLVFSQENKNDPFMYFAPVSYPMDEKDEELLRRSLDLLRSNIKSKTYRTLMKHFEIVPQQSLSQALSEKVALPAHPNYEKLLAKLEAKEAAKDFEGFYDTARELFLLAVENDDQNLLSAFADMYEENESEFREKHPDEFAELQQEIDTETRKHPGVPDLPNIISGTSIKTSIKLMPVLTKMGHLTNSMKDTTQKVKLAKQALQILGRDENPHLWAMLNADLASSFTFLPSGDRFENLEQAIMHAQFALEEVSKVDHPFEWAHLQLMLANAYSEHLVGDPSKNTEIAIECYEKVLTVFERGVHPKEWASTQYHLGLAYLNRHKGARDENIQLALSHCSQALSVYTLENDNEDWARVHNNLATTYIIKYQLSTDSKDIEKAIFHGEEALKGFLLLDDPELQGFAYNTLGLAYSYRPIDSRTENVNKAISCFEKALHAHTDLVYPFEHFKASRNLGDLYFDEQCWDDANNIYEKAIAHGANLLHDAYTEIGRKEEVSLTAQLYSRAAYCKLKLGDVSGALSTFEQGKTRLLSETLALGQINLQRLPQETQSLLINARKQVAILENEMRLSQNIPERRNNRIVADELKQARIFLLSLIDSIIEDYPTLFPQGLELSSLLDLVPENGALVMPLITSQGSAVFLIPYGVDEITKEHAVWLNDFTDDNLSQLLYGSDANHYSDGWIGAYLNKSGQGFSAWRATMKNIGAQLWTKLLDPIHILCKDICITRLIFFPSGGLQLLPIHSAWRMVDNAKRYLIDDYEVSYVPSGYVLDVSYRRAEKQISKSALVVGINDYINAESLENAVPEALIVAEILETNPLLDAEATKNAVVSKVSGKSYLHFSCHGYFSWSDPLVSGLTLYDKGITYSEIITMMDLVSARLVTLSACETGITDIQGSPDEYVGLPAGFIQAGAAAVVSSLWVVEDQSAALLMERFYRNYLRKGMSLAAALREAQIWLRDATREDIEEYYKSSSITSRMDPDKIQISLRELSNRWTSKGDRPYNDPFYWAAFTLTGL